MASISRRLFLQGAAGLAWTTAGLGAYAFGFEPGLRLNVTSYCVTPPHWPGGLTLKAAVLADIHACEPWMPASRVRGIANLTNDLAPDIVFLLGDFSGGHRFVTGPVMPDEWGEALSVLKAPLGVYSVLGNHDWWHGALPGMPADGAQGVRRALRSAGIDALENNASRLIKNGQPFWVAGLGDQIGEPKAHWRFRSLDDLAGTLAQIKDPAPVILLAHEPAIFQRVPDRVSLTLCGHTHGGQVNLPIFSQRFLRHYYGIGLLYGHIVKRDRHLIISAGLGTSYAPVRFMRPPEVVELIIGGCGRNPELGPNPTWRNRTGPAGILIAAERRFPLEGRGRSCPFADRHRSWVDLVFATTGTGESSYGPICRIGRVSERDIDPGALGRKRIWRGTRLPQPKASAGARRKHAPDAVPVVFATGPRAAWFQRKFTADGLPAVGIDARHAKAVLNTAPGKTGAIRRRRRSKRFPSDCGGLALPGPGRFLAGGSRQELRDDGGGAIAS